jgi:hypothetical protein
MGRLPGVSCSLFLLLGTAAYAQNTLHTFRERFVTPARRTFRTP